MEYYKRILCISMSDLIRDDRPDNNPENEYLAPIMSESCYGAMASRKKVIVMRKGIGRGISSLVSVESLPSVYKEKVTAKYGKVSIAILRSWFGTNLYTNIEATTFYAAFRFDNGNVLTSEQQREYIINASVLHAVVSLITDAQMQCAVMNDGRLKWDEMMTAISFYQKEFGHTLPLSPSRFKKRVEDFQKDGYASLISKKFGNQNKRKATISAAFESK